MRASLQQQQLKFEYETSLLNTRIEVQEQAFETVSLEIHDNLGQMLSLGCIQLATVKNEIKDREMAGKLDSILQLFKKSVKDIRLLSHTLNTNLVEHLELKQSIQTELDRIEAFSNISCSLDAGYEEEALFPKQRIIIFRIIQEALQNVLKHAKASAIHIVIERGRSIL